MPAGRGIEDRKTSMDKEGFRQMLQERQVPEDQLEEHISLAERFENWALERGTGGPARADDVRAFSAILIEEGLNTWDSYVTLVRYGRFAKNDEVYVAAVELVDGSEALDGLYEKLGQAVGEKRRNEVFEGIEIPPLGTPSSEKPRFTQAVMERLERLVDAETCQEILSGSLRHLEDARYLDERAKYAECRDIDEYLERKGREFIAQLEQIRDEGGLFFTQPITDAVIDFVRGHPEIAQGVRDGTVLYEVKIPYMAREYLAETDERMRRYYYCHCPWVRESLKEGDVRVSPTFCQCSAGFHKKSWEVILDQPLEAEIVETVLKGDPWCKIAIYLPEQAVPGAGGAR
jgi:hypothetical protein